METKSDPNTWSTQEVSAWLTQVGFSQYIQLFLEQGVDGEVLMALTEKDLKSEPLKLKKIGDCKKLYTHISQLCRSVGPVQKN